VAVAGTTEPQAVRQALAGRSIQMPSGFDALLDAQTQYLHKRAVIGRMKERNVIWPMWISTR